MFAQSIIVFLIWIVSKSKRLLFDLNERAPQAKYSLPPEKNSRILDLKLKPDLKLKICRKLNYNPTLETEGFYSNSASLLIVASTKCRARHACMSANTKAQLIIQLF